MIDIRHGDCLDLLRQMDDNSVDSIVTDPPYGLNFMNKHWDYQLPDVAIWTECLRVLKPGGHMACFGGSRTHHRIWCAIEDAGFEIRDTIMWIHGQGFPKSLDVSKSIDKLMGAEREVIGVHHRHGGGNEISGSMSGPLGIASELPLTAPSSPEAKLWDGWHTQLKPAHEPILLARKKLSEKTVAANVLKWGTGAINVDACRVPTDELKPYSAGLHRVSPSSFNDDAWVGADQQKPAPSGRFPPNVCHDGSDDVLEAFPMTTKAGNKKSQPASPGTSMFGIGEHAHNPKILGDNGGSAARFFYAAKASKSDRCGSRHPTIKPIKLMQWLVSLITPPGGIVLDPFAGSGTTGQAAFDGGFDAILMEREAEYVADIRRRFELPVWG